MAHKNTWIAVGMGLLACLLVACGTSPTPETVIVKETAIVTQEIEVTRIVNVEETVVVTTTPEPPTPTPVPRIIFEDDFESPDPGWELGTDESSERFIDEGGLHVRVNAAMTMSWATNRELQSLDDFDLEVDASQVSGPDDNEYGILFRFQDAQNYYLFAISGNGHFDLFCLVDGQPYNVVNWTEVPSVEQGQSTNHLRLFADGATISMYANGELLATVPDNTFRRGDIGLMAGSFEEGGVEIAFDNLKVAEIEEGSAP
jgi:hypothetical protein